MRCPQCGHENAAEMKSCGECGSHLTAACANHRPPLPAGCHLRGQDPEGGPSPPTFPSSNRLSSSWSLTSGSPRRSVSPYRPRCLRLRTSWSTRPSSRTRTLLHKLTAEIGTQEKVGAVCRSASIPAPLCAIAPSVWGPVREDCQRSQQPPEPRGCLVPTVSDGNSDCRPQKSS
jgi:zinc ribbon protein